jgi:diguanylate cyclase (GGDEF)-like protein
MDPDVTKHDTSRLDPEAVGLLAIDASDRIYLANSAAARLTTRDRGELVGMRLIDVVRPAEPGAERVTSALDDARRHGASWAGALAVADGRAQPLRLEAIITPLTGPGGLVIVVVMIDARVSALGPAGWLALHDPLTGLANRTLLQDRFTQTAAHAKRHRSHVAVLFLDIDGFKAVNDTLGHETGDRVLQDMAERVSQLLRPTDTLARFGGDELVAVCEVPSMEALQEITDRLSSQAVVEVEPGWEVRMSVGAAMGASAALEDMVRQADGAMYRSKHSGHAELDLTLDDAD